ncbi:hypothetical protein [Phenylobacterium sp.]|uniref:hypothetical protein n=1 Tax=Phenylobacterium sp. TaxID=1871053 RepID=UPI0025E16150|nr:hypothetical protein [Phenylobacterium sp.]MBX3484056.1 hypothetical protein [Phenylobacterium sp.]MCW5761545.1 hypothetical protein [Phenylobacterium sp.]
MRRAILGVLLALGVAGAAGAAEYVVVASTDPAVKVGASVDAGQRLALGAGQTVRLMSASGEVSTLKGGASGATVPKAAASDPVRVQALAALVSPPPTGRVFGGRRGGVCPDPADLKSFDAILAAQAGGCASAAREAFDTYLARTTK